MGIRPGTMQDGPDAASEIEVCENDPDRRPRGAGIAMPCQRCFDDTGALGPHPMLTLVTIGEMTQWTRLRSWEPANRASSRTG